MAIPGVLLLGGAVVFLLAASGKKKTGTTTQVAPTGTGIITRVVPTGTGSVELPPENQVQMAAALTALKVNQNGGIDGPVPAAAVAQATALAAAFEAAGYPNAAASLRAYAKKAAEWVPTANVVPQLPTIDSATMDQINRAIQMERDPKKLRALAEALKNSPAGSTPQAQALIATLNAMATQIEAQQVTGSVISQIDKVIKDAAPTFGGDPITHSPITDAPAAVVVPSTPVPGRLPAAKTPLQIAADNMVANLWDTINGATSLKTAKGREDKSLVMKFQKLANMSADGKTGPGVLLAAANAGVARVLPPVFYWPVSATAKNVLAYRVSLRSVADDATKAGDTMRAAALETAAKTERGQGGIVGTMPA